MPYLSNPSNYQTLTTIRMHSRSAKKIIEHFSKHPDQISKIQYGDFNPRNVRLCSSPMRLLAYISRRHWIRTTKYDHRGVLLLAQILHENPDFIPMLTFSDLFDYRTIDDQIIPIETKVKSRFDFSLFESLLAYHHNKDSFPIPIRFTACYTLINILEAHNYFYKKINFRYDISLYNQLICMLLNGGERGFKVLCEITYCNTSFACHLIANIINELKSTGQTRYMQLLENLQKYVDSRESLYYIYKHHNSSFKVLSDFKLITEETLKLY